MIAPEQLAIPDVASVPAKLTVTGLLFQPLAFGAGAALTPDCSRAAPSALVTEAVFLHQMGDASFIRMAVRFCPSGMCAIDAGL